MKRLLKYPRMLAALVCALVSASLTGCSPATTTAEEFSLLYGIAGDIEVRGDDFSQLVDFRAADLDEHRPYFSFLYEPNPNTPVIMNTGNYWFKVSWAKAPVGAFDSPQPVWTAELPGFQKFLKLQIRGNDQVLTRTLVEIIRTRALEAGAKNERHDLRNASEQPPGRRRTGRRMMRPLG